MSDMTTLKIPEQLSEIPYSRRKDVAILKKIYGYEEIFRRANTIGPLQYLSRENGGLIDIPSFTQDISDAFQVLQDVRSTYRTAVVRFLLSPVSTREMYACEIYTQLSETYGLGHGDSMPGGIINAVLSFLESVEDRTS